MCQVEMLEMYSIVQTVHNEPREGRRWTGEVCQVEMYSIVQNVLHEPLADEDCTMSIKEQPRRCILTGHISLTNF